VIAAPCSSCSHLVRVLAMLRSPRGHYQLCAGCLGPDAALPAPSTNPEVVADRRARAAAAAEVLEWLAGPAAWRRRHPDRWQGEAHLDQRGAA
jgi:hypothetical protein